MPVVTPVIRPKLVAESANSSLLMTFGRVYRRLGLKQPAPEFQAEYHAFAGLRSTISLRNNRLQARISDLLRGAPPIILEALAEILLSKLYRRRVSREAQECYRAYILKDEVRARTEEVRRQRGRKIQRPAGGFFFNLNDIFADLNQRFFRGELPQPQIGWSAVRSRTILGHYDSAHHSITISRLLDSHRVSKLLVEYVMFHEMLHILYPVERNGSRRVVHSRQFQEAERQFPGYKQACKLLKAVSSRGLE